MGGGSQETDYKVRNTGDNLDFLLASEVGARVGAVSQD